MKNRYLLCGFAAALIAPAHADVTVDITGATAFRAATLLSIKAKFDESGQPYQFSHDRLPGQWSGATRSIWKGTFPGVSGTTIIRTSFNGSVEGIRALIDSPAADPTYYTDVPGNFVTAAAIGGGETHTNTVGFAKTVAAAQSEIAFSDVAVAATPFAGASLQPSDPAAGVVVFTMLTNEGSPITNVTTQNFRALFGTGFQPRSLFTGNAADDDVLVFATGRNDGSGTRTTYLAETGFGIANTVNQFIVNVGSGNVNEVIQLVPAGGVNDPILPGQTVNNRSIVWGQDIPGNGGYASGGLLVEAMGRTSASVQVLDENGVDAFGENIALDLVTFLSLNDAVNARTAGAVFCAYNGVKLDDIAASGSTMSAADLAKVTRGAYTAWSYQQMYRRGDLTGASDTVTVYDGIKAAIGTNLGAAGIPIADMKAARDFDGGVVGSTEL